MAESEKIRDNTQRPHAQRVKDDAQMMDAVLKMEKEGWTRISSTSLQYVRPTGCGFVLYVNNEWKWLADRNGVPRKKGTRMLLESAMQDVQDIINQ